MNIAQNVDRAALHFPEHEAILFEGRTMTYAELRRAVDRVAHGLVSLGVERGDRVALLLPNIPAFPVAYLACQKVGAITVSVNTMLTTGELEYVFADSGATTAFTTAELLPGLEPLVGPELQAGRVIVCEGDAASHRALDELGAGTETPFVARDLAPDTPAAILYTSGTTGKQKGAVLSHGNVVSNTTATGHCLRLDPQDRSLLFLPLFHCFGQNFVLNAAFGAAATVVLHRRYVPEQVLASIRDDRVTRFFAVPAIYIGLLEAGVQPQDLPSVTYYFSAAATLPVEIGERWRRVFGRAIHEGYGLTETSPHATHNHIWEHRPGTVGTPVENVEVRVVDEHERDVEAGEWGEVVIRGPNVMLGYWNRPEETAEAMRGGWFHTGDIGFLDEAGYLSVVDRKKDMINAAGFKIWPREVEEVLYEHPAVAECAVVGVPHPVRGEAATAVVVARPESELTVEALDAFCRERLAAYKVPSSFELVESLPLSPTGKVLKRVLRAERASPPARSPL